MTASPDTISLQGRRRSVSPQALAAPSPTPTELETLLTIAARVPDHGKLAPWRFIVFEREGQARAGDILAEVYQAANPDTHPKRIELERKRLSFAPLVVAVVSRAAPHEKIPEWEQIMSAGAVCMNLVLAANAMGFATSWLTEWYAYDQAGAGAIRPGRPRKDRRLHSHRTTDHGSGRPRAARAGRPAHTLLKSTLNRDLAARRAASSAMP